VCGHHVLAFCDQCLEVVKLAPFDGLRVLEVEFREFCGEPVHLTQQRDHYKELWGHGLPTLAADKVDEEGGLALTHDGVNDVYDRNTIRD
jgi:hypothetical protein